MAENEGEKNVRGGRFARMRSSIRTQYSLATAFFLLVILAVFYIGGRIVLVRFVRETEEQVKSVGADVSRMAYRNADRMKRANERLVGPVAAGLGSGAAAADLLSGDGFASVSLIAGYSAAGGFLSAAQRRDGGVEALDENAFRPYAERIDAWLKGVDASSEKNPVGIMSLAGVPHYVMCVRETEAGVRVVLGAPFDTDAFSSQVRDGFGAYRVKVVSQDSGTAMRRVAGGPHASGSGFASMMSEALNYYSGGFWDVGGDSVEAVFSVCDVAGRPVSTMSVSLPRSFSGVTGLAVERLTLFVAVAGILLVLPVFWLQGRVLLNPLSKMTEALRELSDRHDEADCPRLEWQGKDEFALLADSVNRMLETISAKTVRLGQLRVRQRALIRGVPDALAVFDVQGRLVSVNKQPEGVEALPGFRPQETLDGAVFGPDGVAAFAAALGKAFSGVGIGRARLVDRSGGGPEESHRHFEVRVTRMDDHFALAIVRDVTQEYAEHRLRLAAEQRGLDMLKRESLTLLAAGIAHDVNNILAVILSTAEAAFATRGDGEEIGVVRDAVKRGQAMTRELMTYAGQSKVALQRAKADLVVKDVMALAERMVPANVELTYSLSDRAPDVDVDPNQFWKVLFNIVKNAGEAIGENRGRIVISTEPFEMTEAAASEFASEQPLPAGSGVVFRIADDGPGIPFDLLHRLFDPYVSSKSAGRGLGLATVRTIVEAHGGGIKVSSELGKGTTFHIYLPEAKLPLDPKALPVRKEGSLPIEVLVVDNDEAILKTSAILLKALKVTPHVARGRNDALGILRRHPAGVGAILLDANLGGIDTVRLLDAFRTAAPQVRVIVSSGSREEDLRRMFASSPYDAFLGKPYTLAELKAALLS